MRNPDNPRGPYKIRDQQERFWKKVDKSNPESCWQWIGTLNRDGYGEFRLSRSNGHILAHRASFQYIVGLIGDGLTIDHLCRNRACVNPDHMELVPIGVNVLRGLSVSGINSRKDKCLKGHEYYPDNVSLSTRNGRIKRRCKKCNREWQNARYRRLINGNANNGYDESGQKQKAVNGQA